MSHQATALVLLSGGLDSATVLAIAKDEGHRCHCLTFDYGQRHRSEVARAKQIARHNGVDLSVISIDLAAIGGSALTDSTLEVPVDAPTTGIPITYVPARNTIFLSYALAKAEVLDVTEIFIGVNAVDYSGYPDCRPEYIAAFESMARVATKAQIEGRQIRIRTPLIDLSKADIIRKGHALGVDYAATVSCYQADDAGRACGRCDSCRLRRQGFIDAGVPDPTVYR